MPFKRELKKYYRLSKPGIVYANILTALAGYLFASAFVISVSVLLGLIVGFALLIAGGCAYNNYLDRSIDRAMQRTRSRALVTGDLTSVQALTFATLATIFGIGLLAITQNGLTVLLGIIGFVDYVFLYGYTKRKTVHGTLVGAISGSVSLVAGYVAVTNTLDATAWALLTLMAVWQMAHFYAIALYRTKDYAAAKIPVLPVVRGAQATKIQIVGYQILFVCFSLVLIFVSDIGIIAGGALTLLGAWWLLKSLETYRTMEPTAWGKKVFLVSLKVMLGMSFLLAIGPLLV